MSNYSDQLVLKALEWLRKEMTKRIFSQGIASDGQPIGQHPDGSPVKLVDTGQLRKSLTIERTANGWTLLVKSFKADANEKRYKKAIFKPTKDELDGVLRILYSFDYRRLRI